MKNKVAKNAEPKPNQPQAAAQPLTREYIYDELNRRAVTLSGMPKRCSAPICKRLRRCADPGYQCERDFPEPPMTEAEEAKLKFWLRKALDAEIARRKALGQWRGDSLRALSPGPSAGVSAPTREPCPYKASPDRSASSRRGGRS